MRAVLVDDEMHARAELAALLEETGAFTLVGECGNAIEALHAIRQERPDVVFLDIQMPAISGFELLSMIETGTRHVEPERWSSRNPVAKAMTWIAYGIVRVAMGFLGYGGQEWFPRRLR